jgi:hypothetical protein
MGGCSTSELSADEMRTVVGTVHVIGNEPFTRLALEMENKRVFVLECSNTLRAMLLTKQGQVVRVHFRKIKAVPEGEAVEVSDVEEISH